MAVLNTSKGPSTIITSGAIISVNKTTGVVAHSQGTTPSADLILDLRGTNSIHSGGNKKSQDIIYDAHYLQFQHHSSHSTLLDSRDDDDFNIILQRTFRFLEIAASLSACLPLDTRNWEIPARLTLLHSIPASVGSYWPTHDAYTYAVTGLRCHFARTAPFRRMPLSFGPSPSPRQDLNGRPRGLSNEVSRTTHVTFKTNKSSLSTLLPTSDFRFSTGGSWGEVTLAFTELDNLNWLGGRGYNFLAFIVHGVEYGSTPNEVIKGNYLPVLFENLADPITTGREELGFSKVYATLDAHRDEAKGTFCLSAGWLGTEFLRVLIHGIEQLPDTPYKADSPLLHYKVIPSNGGEGKADVEHVSVGTKPKREGTERAWRASNAEVAWTGLEDRELEDAFPTLANIIKGLRDVEIVEILQVDLKADC
ncbi:hypothetical protein VE03_06890 [Pseudogymnoascus sp. 23342-1-I1]|nr:hypothetical protein VE03_06890 [Pseudogymnoascus sp. 23342-1-I1]